MQKKPEFEKSTIRELGAIKDITQGNVGGAREDHIQVVGLPRGVFGSVSGQPFTP